MPHLSTWKNKCPNEDPQETIAHLQSQLDECRKERAAMHEDAAQCLARRQDYAQRVQDLHTALAASQAELADMTHRFKHYSATMEAERAKGKT